MFVGLVTYLTQPCSIGSGVLSPEMFGDGRRRREHQTPRGGAHSPREVGSVSQHRRRMAAGGRVVGARPFGGVTLDDIAVLEIQRSAKKNANLTKQDPGRARQSR